MYLSANRLPYHLCGNKPGCPCIKRGVLLVYQVIGQCEWFMLCSKENGIHGKTLAKLHVTNAVAHHHTFLKIYPGRSSWACMPMPVLGLRLRSSSEVDVAEYTLSTLPPFATIAARMLLFISRSVSIVIIPRPTPR